MSPLRSISQVLGLAAITAAAALGVLWPRATLAEDDDAANGLTLDGTKVNDVVVTGELVRDPKSKSGWFVAIEAENRGTEEATADLETDVTRQVTATGARVGPMPTSMWKKKEKVTVAAGAKVGRRYEVPPALAARITRAANEEAAVAKAMEKGTYQMPARTTTFAIAFRGPWADETWTKKEFWASGKEGDFMPVGPPPAPVRPVVF